MTTNLVSPSGAISDDALASQMDGRIALNEKKLALKEKKMMMELQQQRMEDKEWEYKMQENIMQFMTAVMNCLPDTGSGNRDATVLVPTASDDHNTAGGGVDNGCWDDSMDDDSSDKEN